MRKVFRHIWKNNILVECVLALCLLVDGDHRQEYREAIKEARYVHHNYHKKTPRLRDRRKSRR